MSDKAELKYSAWLGGNIEPTAEVRVSVTKEKYTWAAQVVVHIPMLDKFMRFDDLGAAVAYCHQSLSEVGLTLPEGWLTEQSVTREINA